MPINRQSIPGIGTWITRTQAFVTTGNTVDVSTDGAERIVLVHAQMTQAATPGAGDHPLHFEETLRSDGLLDVGTDGVVGLRRASSSNTSGANVLVTFIDFGNDRHFITGFGVFLRKTIQFTTTGATIEIDCGGLDKVRVLGLATVSTSYDSQDALVVDEDVDDKGFIIVPSTGTITLRRPAVGRDDLQGTIHLSDGDTARIPGLGTLFSTKTNFSGTDTSVEVDTKGYSNVLVYSVIPFATPTGAISDDDANVLVSETADADGVIAVSGGTITVARSASGLTGMGIVVNMIGF